MVPVFRDPHIDPRRLAPEAEWTREGAKQSADRMPPFAREFFGRLFAELPALEGEAVYLRWSRQPEDVYAFFDRGPVGFFVQIDPHLEYIIVCGGGGSGEHGAWGDNDLLQGALEHVRSLVGNATGRSPP